MVEIHMSDIIPLIGIPEPPSGRASYNISCPCCDEKPKDKHLNINLKKDVFCCPRCHFSGGIFDLYAYYTGADRQNVRKILLDRLNLRDNDTSYQGTALRKRRAIIKSHEEEIEVPITDVDTRHETYTALLGKLSLASDHRENLQNRGLNDEVINQLGYKTTPLVGTTVLAKQLLDEGYYLSGVPGFYHLKNGSWSFVREERGILIPVRNPEGKIQGLQIRRDNATKRKFRWVSSVGKQDGTRAEGWTHLAGPPQETILLTEGPMKADVIHFLTGQTVLAVPGVNTLTQLKLSLEYLKGHGVTHIMTCFDMDYLTNPHVQKGYFDLAQQLSQMGFQYGTYLWDPKYKGLDDYVWQYCYRQGF